MAELVIFDCDGVLVDSDRISLSTPPERCIVVEDSPFSWNWQFWSRLAAAILTT